MSRTLQFPDGAAFLRLNTMALVGMSPASAEMTEEQRAEAVSAILGESAASIPGYEEGGALSFECSINIVTATREARGPDSESHRCGPIWRI